MKPLRKIALVINRKKVGADALAEKIVHLAATHGVETQLTGEYPLPLDFLAADTDACGVLGGDGTLLGTVSSAVHRDVPVFGVNQGKLGFMATFSPEKFCQQLPEILQGHYRIESRLLLSAELSSGVRLNALNDIVLKTARSSRLITFRVYCNEEFVTRYHCDGLIFSTPTGSTAYNLSANGPIIHPSSAVITMTPICPHTLSNRSVIFPQDVCLRIETESNTPPEINIDGRIIATENALPLGIRQSAKRIKLLQPLDYDYFGILRSKLQWGGETD